MCDCVVCADAALTVTMMGKGKGVPMNMRGNDKKMREQQQMRDQMMGDDRCAARHFTPRNIPLEIIILLCERRQTQHVTSLRSCKRAHPEGSPTLWRCNLAPLPSSIDSSLTHSVLHLGFAATASPSSPSTFAVPSARLLDLHFLNHLSIITHVNTDAHMYIHT